MHSPVSHSVPALLYPTCLLGCQGFVAERSWPRPHSLAKMTHIFSILPQIWCTTAHCIAMLLDCSKSAAGRQPWERSTALYWLLRCVCTQQIHLPDEDFDLQQATMLALLLGLVAAEVLQAAGTRLQQIPTPTSQHSLRPMALELSTEPDNAIPQC